MSERGSVAGALLVGHLTITLPILVSMFASVSLIADPLIGGLVGFVPSYAWWAVVTPRWRHWATGSGVDQDALQRAAYKSGLVWPSGHFMERTELHLSDRTFFSLVTFLALASFLTAETVLSELLESRLGLPGMIGPLVSAAISAAIVIPVQSRLRRFLSRVRDQNGALPTGDGPALPDADPASGNNR